MDIEKKINKVLDMIRPYIRNDGGDVEFLRFENGVVYVSLVGACSECPLADHTLESGIESALVNEIPEVIKVVNED
ncbi:MAG: NifU family protein [Bacilli bacterium]|nr:NifU family protein [Bacilli bacterium]